MNQKSLLIHTDSLTSTPLLINFSYGLKCSLRLGLHHAIELCVEILELTLFEHGRLPSCHWTLHKNTSSVQTSMVVELLSSLLKSLAVQIFCQRLFVQVACHISKVIILLVLKQDWLWLAFVFCPVFYVPVRKFIFWLMSNLLKTLVLSEYNQFFSVHNEDSDYKGFMLYEVFTLHLS